MIHRNLVIEAHIKGSRSEGRGDGFLTNLIAPEDRSRGLRLIKGGEVLVHAG